MQIKEMHETPRLPLHYILEMPDGSCHLVYITPFRRISEKDLVPCKTAPKKIGATPVSSYMLKCYGLTKCDD